jgi:hypothetical protein
MRANRRYRVGLLVLAALGCADLAALSSLQHGLVARFNEAGISINLHNHQNLSVVFVNSKLAELPDSERAATAREVAQFVRDHYSGYRSLTSIAVGFRQAMKVGMVSFSATKLSYTYSTADLGPPQDTLQTQHPQ